MFNVTQLRVLWTGRETTARRIYRVVTEPGVQQLLACVADTPEEILHCIVSDIGSLSLHVLAPDSAYSAVRFDLLAMTACMCIHFSDALRRKSVGQGLGTMAPCADEQGRRSELRDKCDVCQLLLVSQFHRQVRSLGFASQACCFLTAFCCQFGSAE